MTSQNVLLQDIPLPKQDDIIDIIRNVRATLNIHKMYPLGHQMILRSITRLHGIVKKFCQDAQKLVLSASADGLEINGERLSRAVPEREHSQEITQILLGVGLSTIVFHSQTAVKEMVSLLGTIMFHDPQHNGPLDADRLQTQYQTILLNPVVVRRNASSRVRDKLSLKEIVSSMNREEILRELGVKSGNLPDELRPDDPNHPDNAAPLPSPSELANRAMQALPAWVRSGQFLSDLFKDYPSQDSLSAADSFGGRARPQTAPSLPSVPTSGRPSSATSSFPKIDGGGKDSSILRGTSAFQKLNEASAQSILGRPSTSTQSSASFSPPSNWASIQDKPVTAIPAEMQPESVAASPFLPEMIQSGQIERYLQAYFSHQQKLSSTLQPQDASQPPSADAERLAAEQISSSLDHLKRSLQQVNDPRLREAFQSQVSRQIADLSPDLVTRYLQQIPPEDAQQNHLKSTILSQLAPQKLEASQESIIQQIQQIQQPEAATGAMLLLQETVQYQIEQGIASGIKHALQKIDSLQKEHTSQALQASSQHLLQQIASDKNLSHLLRHGLKLEGQEARELLSQFAPQTIPQCIEDIAKSTSDAERLRHIELLVEIARQAPVHIREAGFAPLLPRIEILELSPSIREMLLELIRHFAPGSFETYLLRRLTEEFDKVKRAALIRQAISLDTPRVREAFLRLAERRSFRDDPESEELAFQYLHRTQTCDLIDFLERWSLDPTHELSTRHSAIFALGLFQEPPSLAALTRILLNRDEANQPLFPEDLRFQALSALTRFRRTDVAPLLQRLATDPSLLLASFASSLLDGQSLSQLPDEAFEDALQAAQTMLGNPDLPSQEPSEHATLFALPKLSSLSKKRTPPPAKSSFRLRNVLLFLAILAISLSLGLLFGWLFQG